MNESTKKVRHREVFAIDVADILYLYMHARYVFDTALLAPELEVILKNNLIAMSQRFITDNIERHM